MIVRIVALAAAVLILAATSAADGKGIGRVKVCGANGCADAPRTARHSLMFDFERATDPPRRRARFFRVVMEVRDGERTVNRLRFIWVPSLRMVRARFDDRGPMWSAVGRQTADVLRATSRRLRPFAAARMPL